MQALDLLICDVSVAGDNGLDLARELRRLPGMQDVPVMFVSRTQLPDIVRRSHDAGAAYYLRKPLDPDVLIDLTLSEEPIDIIADGFDVAIRIGQGADSSLRTSRLFSFRRPLVAAPALVEAMGTPVRPEDLARFPAVIPTHVPWGDDWEFAKAGEPPVAVRMKGAFRVNNAAAMVPVAVAGIGVTLIPEYFVWRELQDGSLIELLPDWIAPSAPIYLVTPPGRVRPARVRVLLDFLRERFATGFRAQGIEH
jgi:DNA-binding transcriptional LysR family regulator